MTWSALWSVIAWGGLLVALRTVWRDQRGVSSKGSNRRVLLATAFAGFLSTWTFMLLMTAQDVARFHSFAEWSAQSNLFFDAYHRVMGAPAAWFWSQHLMMWAPAAVLFFHGRGETKQAPSWAYIWVGMCVAISFALPLFLIRCDGEDATGGSDRERVSPLIVACVMIMTLATILATGTSDSNFTWAMIVLHGSALLSVAPGLRSWRPTRAASLVGYGFVGVVALSAWWWFLVTNLGELSAQQLFHVVIDDPAQSSITIDVLMTVLVYGWHVARRDGARASAVFVATTLVLSLGAAFAIDRFRQVRSGAHA